MRAVYLGGPITGLTFDDAEGWRETIVKRPDWPAGWTALSPMRGKEKFRVPGLLASTFDEGPAAVRQDLGDIDTASAVLFNFLGARTVSLGSSAEMGYAFSRNKPIIVALDPEPDPFNPHRHVFVDFMASYVVTSVKAALATIRSLETDERGARRTKDRHRVASPVARR